MLVSQKKNSLIERDHIYTTRNACGKLPYRKLFHKMEAQMPSITYQEKKHSTNVHFYLTYEKPLLHSLLSKGDLSENTFF